MLLVLGCRVIACVLCLICAGLVVIYFEVGFGCFVSCLLLVLTDLGVV